MTKRTSFFLAFSLAFSFAFTARAETLRAAVANEVVVDRPIEEVFDFATTAGNWEKWHPNTLKTAGAIDHSAVVGEQITEWLRVGPLPLGKVTWTVTEHVAPTRWAFAVELPGIAQFSITYTFRTVEGGSTLFRREMALETENSLLATLFRLSGPFAKASSEIAVRHFKTVIEGT